MIATLRRLLHGTSSLLRTNFGKLFMVLILVGIIGSFVASVSATSRFNATSGQPHAPGPTAPVAFSPGGEWLATAVEEVRLWNIRSGEVVMRFEEDDINSLAFSHDGRYLAGGTWKGKVVVWDLLNRTRVAVLDTGVVGRLDRGVVDVEFSAEDLLVSAAGTMVHGWDLETKQARFKFDTGSEIQDLACNPAGETIAVAAESHLLILDDAGVRATLPGNWTSVNFCKSDELLAIIWCGHCSGPDYFFPGAKLKARDGQVAITLTTTDLAPTSYVKMPFFQTDVDLRATTLAAVDWDATVSLWEVGQTREPRVLEGRHDIGLMHVALSPSGGQVAYTDMYGCATVRETKTGTIVQKLPRKRYVPWVPYSVLLSTWLAAFVLPHFIRPGPALAD